MSKTIYAESTEHLEELLHKSNNMLSMIVKKNISYLHVWNGFLSSDPDDASTQAYLESAQQQLGFAEFYFLSYDGNYMTPSGETGYLGLQTNLDEQLSDQKDIVLNTALPGQDPMLVFICPETKGIYRGFAYDAIAISHYNNVVQFVKEYSPKSLRNREGFWYNRRKPPREAPSWKSTPKTPAAKQWLLT